MPGSKRYSHQREEIYAAVYSTTTHPTAEMVYNRLKPLMPKLSLGTVYRNLHQMAEEGRLMELPGPVVRFDANTAPHTHFSCSECGGVHDLDLPYDPRLDQLAEQAGGRVRNHNLMFYGVCPGCMGHEQET